MRLNIKIRPIGYKITLPAIIIFAVGSMVSSLWLRNHSVGYLRQELPYDPGPALGPDQGHVTFVRVDTPTALPFLGDKSSKLYHKANCPGYPKVQRENRVPFESSQEAEEAKYTRAPDCH